MFPSKQIHLLFFSENFHRFCTRKESQGAFTVHSSRFLAKGASSQLRKMKALWLSWDRNFRRSWCFFRPKNKNTENENGRPETSEEKKMISVTCDVCSAGKCFTRLHVAFLFTTCQLKTGSSSRHRHHPAFRLLRWHHKIDGKALLVKGKVPTGGTFHFLVETPWWSCLSHQNSAQK